MEREREMKREMERERERMCDLGMKKIQQMQMWIEIRQTLGDNLVELDRDDSEDSSESNDDEMRYENQMTKN